MVSMLHNSRTSSKYVPVNKHLLQEEFNNKCVTWLLQSWIHSLQEQMYVQTAVFLLVSVFVSGIVTVCLVTIKDKRKPFKSFSTPFLSICRSTNNLLVIVQRSTVIPLTTLWAPPRLPQTLSPWMCKWMQVRLLVINLLWLIPVARRFKPACTRVVEFKSYPARDVCSCFSVSLWQKYYDVLVLLPRELNSCLRTVRNPPQQTGYRALFCGRYRLEVVSHNELFFMVMNIRDSPP
jgi:hypothetical protein